MLATLNGKHSSTENKPNNGQNDDILNNLETNLRKKKIAKPFLESRNEAKFSNFNWPKNQSYINLRDTEELKQKKGGAFERKTRTKEA